jgi:phosphopantothenoylcysteine synthetase/decarboxylase
MDGPAKVVGVVGSAAGGVEDLRAAVVEPLIREGHRVAVTLTPTAAQWLEDLGEIAKLQELTCLPVRWNSRLPREARSHPLADLYVAAPASANTVAKLALGIADNQALTVLCENIASTPMVVFPRVNAAHARHPAWESHLNHLRSAGVDLIYGDEVWPLREPRAEGDSRPPPGITSSLPLGSMSRGSKSAG